MSQRLMLLVLVFVLFAAGAAEAQDLARFYLVPKVTKPGFPGAVPKYLNPVDLPGVNVSAMDFGNEDTMLVGAAVTNQQHTAIAANADVIAVPSNLDNTMSAPALSTVRDRLESLKIPTAHFTTANTYREVIGVVGRLFQLFQRFDAIQASEGRLGFFDLDITLSSTVNDLRGALRANFVLAANQLGLDTAGISGSMTLRQALRNLIAQMPPFTLAGETF
jgi:hypothetical protein